MATTDDITPTHGVNTQSQEKYSLADKTFQTKAELERFIRGILFEYNNGRQVGSHDWPYVYAILERHPNRVVIEDCGIKRFLVQWLDNAGIQRRFIAIRNDDSRRDFTWRHVIRERTQMQRVHRVCRWLVRDQIDAFRRKAFASDIALACPISGERITRESSHVDHIAPNTFQALVDGWLLSNGMTSDDLEVVPSREYQEPDRFSDDFIAENWREYHRINAKLRVIDAWTHRRLPRKVA